MSVNLLEMLQGFITPEVVKSASAFLGEDDEQKVQSGLGGILPSILGGLLSKATTKEGAGSIFDMITGKDNDDSILDNLGSILGGGDKTSSILEMGGGLLQSIFGNKGGGIIDLITGLSGMKKESSSSLLNLAIPIVMGFLGREVKKRGLDLGGIVSMLLGQKDFLKKAAPAGLTDALGIGDFDKLADQVKGNLGSIAGEAAGMVEEGAKKGGSFMRSLLPIILLALVAAVLFYFLRGCGDKVATVAEDTLHAADSMVQDVKESLSSIELPGGEKLEVMAGSIEEEFAKFLGGAEKDLSKAFSFDSLQFETGKNTLTPASMKQLETLSKLLKAYPAVEIRLEGNTDNTGDAAANTKLSSDRAESVKMALVEKGIDAKRIVTKGNGDKNPKADNATPEGQAQNRRIDVFVSKY